jgi:hypothetical protein
MIVKYLLSAISKLDYLSDLPINKTKETQIKRTTENDFSSWFKPLQKLNLLYSTVIQAVEGTKIC